MKEKNLPLTHEKSENIITSEGVILKTEPLTLANRILAFLIDTVFNITFLIMAIITITKHSSFFLINFKSIQTLQIIVVVLILFVIPILIETFTSGYSIGKYAIGARIVRDDGGSITFRHVFTRHLIGVVEIYTCSGLIAFISVEFSKQGKRLGDYMAGTYLAKSPSYNAYLPLIMPKEFEDWANKVNISPIPEHLLMEAKSFINRTNSLSDVVRTNYAIDISESLLKYVDIAPPKNFDKERFIASVLVVKRDTEFRKMLAKRKNI